MGSVVLKRGLLLIASALAGCGGYYDRDGNPAPGTMIVGCDQEVLHYGGWFNGKDDYEACMNYHGYKWKPAF